MKPGGRLQALFSVSLSQTMEEVKTRFHRSGPDVGGAIQALFEVHRHTSSQPLYQTAGCSLTLTNPDVHLNSLFVHLKHEREEG